MHANARLCVLSLALLGAACASSEEPSAYVEGQLPARLDAPYGVPSLVVKVNAQVAPASSRSVAPPGSSISGVYVQAGTVGGYTDASGTVVLSGVPEGFTAIRLEGGGGEVGEVFADLPGKQLVELLISLDSAGASLIFQSEWFGESVVQATTPTQAAGGLLLTSIESPNTVVTLPTGSLEGTLSILADDVIVFGENFAERWPHLQGDLWIQGDNVQVRGLWVDGGLIAEGAGLVMAYAGVTGSTRISGASATLVDTTFCTPPQLTGSSLLMITASQPSVSPACSP